MNLTDELLEMWEADAKRGHTDITAANARLVRVIAEERETARLLAYVTGRLAEVDPMFEQAIIESLEEVERAA